MLCNGESLITRLPLHLPANSPNDSSRSQAPRKLESPRRLSWADRTPSHLQIAQPGPETRQLALANIESLTTLPWWEPSTSMSMSAKRREKPIYCLSHPTRTCGERIARILHESEASFPVLFAFEISPTGFRSSAKSLTNKEFHGGRDRD